MLDLTCFAFRTPDILSPRCYVVIQPRDEQMERALHFVRNLDLLDLLTLAALGQPDQQEAAVEDAVGAWIAVRRGLVAKCGSRLTVAGNERVEGHVNALGQPSLVKMRRDMETLQSCVPYSFFAALKHHPVASLFVFTGPVQPRPLPRKVQ